MKTGLGKLIAGVVLALVGLVVPGLVVVDFFLKRPLSWQFRIPGSQVVRVEEPGRYHLWDDFETVFEGRSYQKVEGLPDGAEIAIRSVDGRVLPFVGDLSTHFSGKSGSKRSIGYVELSEPCELRVLVSGDFEERVVSFSKWEFRQMMTRILGSGVVAFVLVLVGWGAILWGGSQLARSGGKA